MIDEGGKLDCIFNTSGLFPAQECMQKSCALRDILDMSLTCISNRSWLSSNGLLGALILVSPVLNALRFDRALKKLTVESKMATVWTLTL